VCVCVCDGGGGGGGDYAKKICPRHNVAARCSLFGLAGEWRSYVTAAARATAPNVVSKNMRSVAGHQFRAGTHCTRSVRPSAADSCPSARLRFRSFRVHSTLPPEKIQNRRQVSLRSSVRRIAATVVVTVSRWPDAFLAVGPSERRPRSQSSRSPPESPSCSSWSSSSSLPSAVRSHRIRMI